jgi:hypothetical protein
MMGLVQSIGEGCTPLHQGGTGSDWALFPDLRVRHSLTSQIAMRVGALCYKCFQSLRIDAAHLLLRHSPDAQVLLVDIYAGRTLLQTL